MQSTHLLLAEHVFAELRGLERLVVADYDYHAFTNLIVMLSLSAASSLAGARLLPSLSQMAPYQSIATICPVKASAYIHPSIHPRSRRRFEC